MRVTAEHVVPRDGTAASLQQGGVAVTVDCLDPIRTVKDLPRFPGGVELIVDRSTGLLSRAGGVMRA